MNTGRILIVEDEAIVARDIRTRLIKFGYTPVGTTARGESALALAEELCPDVVLMDIHLQGEMDGIKAAAAIRSTLNIPVVFATANADDSTLNRALHAEPFGYILKPFEDRELNTAIEMALYKSRADRKLRESEANNTAVINAAMDCIVTIDVDGRISEFNPAAEQAFGRVRADVLGKVAADLLVPFSSRSTFLSELAKSAQAKVGVRRGQHPEAKPGRYAVLAVSDTGSGMSKEVQARIFEPFFTTKDPGKGTGLGLSTAYGIVNQSNGYIYVYSEPGQGTTFKIYLPISGNSSPAQPDLVEAAPTTYEIGTILMVEDEDGVRRLLRPILDERGYAVLEAAHGKEALAVAKHFNQPIDLLLTDVVMPEMGGRVLAEQFAILHPETKVIFMSGYTDDVIVRQGVLEAEVEFLQKPYTMSALLNKIRKVLDGDRADNDTPKFQKSMEAVV